MTIVEFLAYLRGLDIQIVAEGDRLRCNAPEGVLTPELQAELTTRKAELLSFLQQTQHFSSLPLQPVTRGPVSPLSFAQQRLWFLNQLAPENPFYNVPAAIRLCGALNLAALEQSFNEIVRRHEALRTTFNQVDGQAVQVITPQWELSIPLVDLQNIPISDRDTFAQKLATEEAQRPFNLSSGPLLRVKLLKLQETEHILVLTLHHIVADGWSLGVLIRELGILYTASLQGQIAVLPDLPIQYADFAHWQQTWLQGEVLEAQLNYWRQQLQDIPQLELPCDRPRPPMQTFRGTTQPIHLSPEITKALEALSQQQGTSLFMTLLAAFQTLLYRYTGQEDIAIGSPIANRHRSELEGLIGFFVNSLVLRTHLGGHPTFRELLGRVREVALGAYAHQDLPFEKLVEELEPERDLSRNPLFQVGFALQNAPVEQLELPGLTLKPINFEPGTARFDLEVHLWEPSQGLSRLWQADSQGLTGFVAYSTDLFDRATILRLISHFQTLLAGIVTNPDAHLADLPILTDAERQQLLVDWNQTRTEFAQAACFHHLFAAQAEQTPAAIAVRFNDQQLTYQQLNQRANQLAHHLQQLGVGPNRLVGLCVERSVDAIIGILGILKAGGAYVPLDPDYPRDRLHWMLTDTQVAIVLTQSWLVERLADTSAQLLCLDQNSEWLHEQNQAAPHSQVTAEDLAYVIYTSGSTGQPKGVMIQHRGLCNVVRAQQQVFNLSPASRVLQFSSLSFDASIFEIVMALGSGGSLLIPTQEVRLPGAALLKFLRDQAITHAILPPAVLAVLSPENLPDLRVLISGGEACTSEIVDRWAVGRQFFNAYGPTETTIWATVAQLHPGSGKPTIGRPVANMQIYILDSHLQPVPIGVIGEMYIGGVGLSPGYWQRPELTTERFIPNPFQVSSQDTGNCERLYKTGDLGRYRADGSIEFVGRIDDQIKIRGYRIELGEIETALREHPAVKEAVAIAHATPLGDQRLAAYFTFNSAAQQQLSQELEQQQVDHWQTLYNQTYQQPSSDDPTFNLTGWQSSYTGQPLPPEQMREWLSDRVQQIVALKPQRVLEIGCGTGLLLFQIAPHCAEYWATDFSQTSLASIQQQPTKQSLPQVKLLHKLATDFTEIEAGTFDVVILNSVVQYFPSVDYLMRVLVGAIATLAPGGVLFIGDVRNLSLLPAFHTAVQLDQADASLETTQLRQRIQRSLFEEPELAIDPAFFSALRTRFPQIHDVHIQLSQGHHQNELTQFRYNVLIQLTGDAKDLSKVNSGLCMHSRSLQKQLPEEVNLSSKQWLDWKENQLSVTAIRQYLIEHRPEVWGIKNISNSRVNKAVQVVEWLSRQDSPKTVRRIREALENLSETAIDPQDLWDLATELPYTVEVCWSNSTSDGSYDVVFRSPGTQTSLAMPLTQPMDEAQPWHTYTNQPLQAQVARQFIPQLRQHLAQKLPSYMVPATLLALETLPLTANGKIDRRSLPIPEDIQLESNHLSDTQQSSEQNGARSPLEETLLKIWTDLLRLRQVGIHDNFFELGGHSLLATQLASRIRDALAIEVPLRHIFEAPTIAQLAKVIETLQADQTQKQAPALVKLDRASYRRSRASLMGESPGG